jgi:uncharacterized protein
MLDTDAKRKLLKIARESIKTYLDHGERRSFKVEKEELKEKKGVFITLKIGENLRGCIGRISSDEPLYKTVSEMAIQAAFGDPRFSSLSEEEFKEIEIEISVLSEMKKIKDIEEIKIGAHGLLIKKGHNEGLLLPQVASSCNWDRGTYLTQACYKAGLDGDAWQSEDTEIHIFEADIFSERKLKI